MSSDGQFWGELSEVDVSPEMPPLPAGTYRVVAGKLYRVEEGVPPGLGDRARVNRLEALVRELAEHAHHRPDCAEMEDYYAPCDCGLTEAVRRARKEVGDG